MKKCYGNYMIYPKCENHNKCVEDGCLSMTNIVHAECDCPYTASCHLARQRLQVKFRKDYGYKVEDCDFYKLLKPMYEEIK